MACAPTRCENSAHRGASMFFVLRKYMDFSGQTLAWSLHQEIRVYISFTCQQHGSRQPSGIDMSINKALELIQDSEARFVAFRFCDARGKEQHITMPAHIVDEEFLEEGKMFDGSSIDGWKGIH